MVEYSDTDVLIDSSVNRDENDDEDVTSGCCDPTRAYHRFTGLFLMCLLGFGSYFCFDVPGALQDSFQDDMDLTTSQFVWLYSWYSWPNVIMCFIGGFLLDRVFGIRLGTCIYATLVVIGQIVFAMGGFFNSFWLMVLGRFIFGIGGESLAVAQNNYAVLWFKGKELNMVFGLQLSFARVGSTVNFMVMGSVYKWVQQTYKGHTCIGMTLLMAGTTTIMSLGSAILLAWMDKRAEKALKRNETQQGGEVIKMTDVKDFPVSFWMMTVVCVAYYVVIFPFVALGKMFFERKFGMDPEAANRVNSIIYFISAVASPLLGLLVDRTGRNVMWVLLSVVVSIGCHLLLAFTFLNPYIAMCTLGLAYSMLASALWPMVSLVIPEYQLGTAYGIAQAVQNLGLAVITMVAGMIVDSGGYLLLEMFFLAWLCIALMAVVVIWIYDSVNQGVLNMSVARREEYNTNRVAAEILEREKLLASGSMADGPPSELVLPHSDFHIRNRYLSRIGAPLPPHYNGMMKGQSYRALR